jgi:hypothetical protein
VAAAVIIQLAVAVAAVVEEALMPGLTLSRLHPAGPIPIALGLPATGVAAPMEMAPTAALRTGLAHQL